MKLKTNVPGTPKKSNLATNLYWVVGINVIVVMGISGDEITETLRREEHRGHPPAVRFTGMYEREIPWRTCPWRMTWPPRTILDAEGRIL